MTKWWRLALVGVVVTACAAQPPVPTAPDDPRCADFVRYGDLSGTAVSVLVPDDARAFALAAAPFEACTGATVVYEGGSGDVAPQLRARLAGGDPPDLAHLPGPGLLTELVAAAPPEGRSAVPAPPQVTVNVDQYLPEAYAGAGSVGGTLYAAPLDAAVASWVRYSPAEFADRDLAVPTTWVELTDLVEQVVDDGDTPLCPATTPSGTEVLAGAVLRDAGADVYDRWVEHGLPFDDSRIAAALDDVDVLRDPDALAPPEATLLDGECLLEYPAADRTADDLDVFPLPPTDADAERSVLVTGSLAAAFDSRPEVAAFQAYLSSPQWVTAMAAAATDGWSSAHAALDPSQLTDPQARRTAELLQDPAVVVRYEAVELLPGVVARESLPAAMADWADGDDPEDVLDSVESAWPR